METTQTEETRWATKDTLTGALYPQPNKLIAEKVAEMHGHCEVVPLAPPTDDEREALDAAVREALGLTATTLGVRRVVDMLWTAGFRRQGPITDAQEQAAFESWNGMHVGTVRDRLRAALEAAERAR